uniref:Alpha-endosulfine n=6 Tax=Neoaves TaxID=3078114 RepID=A0A663M8J3_ATHCN
MGGSAVGSSRIRWQVLRTPGLGAAQEDTQEKETITPERAEEAKLKAKYPNLGQKPGGSDFLMKRLQKGQKYFDSGDYNMAKAKMKNKQLPSAGPDKNLVTGDHIPTPQDLPQRKSSLVTSKLAGAAEALPPRWESRAAPGEAGKCSESLAVGWTLEGGESSELWRVNAFQASGVCRRGTCWP